MANIKQTEFEKLPKAEQNFRWAIFLRSNGYEKELSQNVIDELHEKYIVQNKPLKVFTEARR